MQHIKNCRKGESINPPPPPPLLYHDGGMTLRVRPRVKCAFSINLRLYHGGGIFASICLRIEVGLRAAIVGLLLSGP